MEEIWKDINGYEGLYQISNLGNLRSLDRKVKSSHNSYALRKGKVLKPSLNKKGYFVTGLSKDGIRKNVQIHRLVAEAFLDNPNNYTCVNHKDENPSNNQVDNLEWCSYIYNNNYGNRIAKAVEKTTNGKLSKQVNQYSLSGEFINTFPSLHEVGRLYGYDISKISEVARGKRKTAYGYL